MHVSVCARGFLPAIVVSAVVVDIAHKPGARLTWFESQFGHILVIMAGGARQRA